MRLAIALFLIIFLLSVSTCGKREYNIEQKIIGTWKSIHTITDLYDDDVITESFDLKSDKYNFSILEFGENGSFKSYGQYKIDGTDTTNIVKFEPQMGVYRIVDNTLVTRIDGMDKEAEMMLAFDRDDHLTIRSAPMNIHKTDIENQHHYFTSTVIYTKEK